MYPFLAELKQNKQYDKYKTNEYGITVKERWKITFFFYLFVDGNIYNFEQIIQYAIMT